MKKELTETQLKQVNGGIFYLNGNINVDKYPSWANMLTIEIRK